MQTTFVVPDAESGDCRPAPPGQPGVAGSPTSQTRPKAPAGENADKQPAGVVVVSRIFQNQS
jgi:hypothetical protein